MGEQGRLPERGLAAAGDDFGRDAGERGEQGFVRTELQWNQRWARLDDLQPEASGRVVGEPGCAELRDRWAAGGEDEGRRLGAADAEAAIGMLERVCARTEPQIDAALRAFGEQHRDDLLRRAVAEELTERLFVPGDAVAVDQSDEVFGCVTAERGGGEMRVRREEAVRGGVDIGEVATAAA
jgi:hypothetical protein